MSLLMKKILNKIKDSEAKILKATRVTSILANMNIQQR